MRRIPFATSLAALLLLPLPAARAASVPDLSGRWEMDVARCDMWKKAVRPLRRLDTVEQRGDAITWSWLAEQPKGPLEAMLRLTTDGKWTHNSVAGHKCRSRARWDGDTLVVDSHGRFLLIGWHLQDRIHLAAGGAEMHATRRFRMASMDERERWFYQRVGSAGAGDGSSQRAVGAP